MPTILQDVRRALNAAQWHVNVVLNLTEVPDYHPISRKASQVWSDLEYVLESIQKVGPRAAAMHDEGPAIIPVAGKSPDQWMTSHGKKVASLVILTPHQSRVASSKGLRMPRMAAKRRAMTRREFMAALDTANPEAVLVPVVV